MIIKMAYDTGSPLTLTVIKKREIIEPLIVFPEENDYRISDGDGA